MAPTLAPPTAEAHLFDALAFAAQKHRDQRRRDAHASPYINHPIELARVLSVEAGITDVTTLVAAVLHDTIEDTKTTYDELLANDAAKRWRRGGRGHRRQGTPKAERKRLQVVHAPQMSDRAALVKLADKTCNLRDVADNPPVGWPLERRREYFDWARQVVDGLPPVHAPLRAIFDAAYAKRP
jgi:guanosine-3',5'-bis(diphosphate) 3'-pyrophosphohydrolase